MHDALGKATVRLGFLLLWPRLRCCIPVLPRYRYSQSACPYVPFAYQSSSKLLWPSGCSATACSTPLSSWTIYWTATSESLYAIYPHPLSPRYAACVVCHFRLIWKAPLRPPLLLVDIKESIYISLMQPQERSPAAASAHPRDSKKIGHL